MFRSAVRALSIRERIAIVRAIPADELRDDVNEALGRRRAAAWLPLSAYSDLDEDELVAALGISRERLAAALAPPWLATLIDAYTRPREVTVRFPARPWLEPLCGLVAPLVGWADAALSAAGDARETLRAALALRLASAAMRAIVAALGAARLHGELAGETPEARYLAFCESLARPEVRRQFLDDHPVLARDLAAITTSWSAATGELLDRLGHDRAAIAEVFGIAAADPLVHVIELGDRHRGGRAVTCVVFASGARLVYKPRTLATEQAFARVLAWLAARGCEPLDVPRMLGRTSHGWVEWIEAAPCPDREAVARFYRRLGAVAAILYALRITDLHFENVIARGDMPVLVDLEASLQPSTALGGWATAREVAQRELVESVLGTGLFPEAPERAGRLRISGLEDLAGRISTTSMQLVDTGTDTMRFASEPVALPRSHNVPVHAGARAHPADHAEALLAGLAATLRLVIDQQAELLAPAGPLSWFEDTEIRVVMRNTRTYQLLLTEGAHPAYLHDAGERGRMLETLFRDPPAHRAFAAVVRGEIAAVERGDVPIFTTHVGSRALAGDARIPTFFEESGMDATRRRIANLGERDLDRQVWLARASLATLAGERRPLANRHAPSSRPDPRDVLGEAVAIGEHLVATAVRGAGDVTWLGLQADAGGAWAIRPLSLHLYDGLPGVVLFLAHLGARTQRDRFTAYARAGLRAVHRELAAFRAPDAPIGAFSGWGGLVYTYAHLGLLWREPALVAIAEGMLAQLPEAIERDRRLDLMSGSAGCIVALGRLAAAQRALGRSADRARRLASAAADHVLACAQTTATGMAWRPDGDPARSGLSHGTAGFAWALAEAADLADHAGARAALPEVLKTLVPGPMIAWCNGAPGIALARQRIAALIPALAGERTAELAATARYRGHGDDCACHGTMGAIDVLLSAGDRAAAAELLGSAPWRCGTPMKVESPGFMTGLAGIGYQLLRLADPDVPSVLCLALPDRELKTQHSVARPGNGM